MDDDADLAAALALSKAENPEVAKCASDVLNLPKAKRDQSLPILLKLLKNLATELHNEKFRSVKTGNPKINAAIVSVPEAKALMLACGFKEQEDCLVASEGADKKAQEALDLLEEATACYSLSVEFTGHAGAVRCVCALADGSVVTGAMDNVVRIFSKTGGTPLCLTGHSRTVGVDGVLSLCAIGADTVASGARDGKILIWDVGSGSKKAELIGHGEGIDVTNGKSIGALCVLADGTIVSGGWDKTVRVWTETPQVKHGHTVAVNGVCTFSGGEIVSASGDGNVTVWHAGDKSTVGSGGSPARSVCAVGDSGVAYASAHNDGKVRTWAAGATALRSAQASTSYLFSVSYCSSRELLATGGDDGAVKLWSLALEQVQDIPHPMEVFCVCFAGNGDLLTACGDETARLWSRDPRRKAPAATVGEFDAKVAAAAVAAAATAPAAGATGCAGGNWDFEYPVELTGGKKMMIRWRRGESTQDVANRFLQENGLPANHLPDVMAFVSQAQSQAGGAAAGGGGQTYSYPVEVADGRRLTISWAHGEDPMAVAQRFAMQNMIPAAELQDIANFVAQVQGGPAPVAPPVAPAPITAEQVGMITAMGFDETSARAALQASGGNVEMAIARLLG